MAKKKEPLITTGTPAIETPLGRAYHEATARDTEALSQITITGEVIAGYTREEFRKKYHKVPLYAHGLVQNSSKKEVTGKEEWKTHVRNWIVQWQWQIEDEDQLAYNATSIGTSLYEEIVCRMPTHLAYLDDYIDLILNVTNCRNNWPSNIQNLKHLFAYLVNLYNTIEFDYDQSRVMQGWIDEENRQKSEAQAKADKIAKQQKHEQAAKDLVDSINQSDDGGTGL